MAKAVLENFCKAAAHLMSMGFAIQLKNGNNVALRIHPDIHVKGGNINLERAKELVSRVAFPRFSDALLPYHHLRHGSFCIPDEIHPF